jgi:hypothetical protein
MLMLLVFRNLSGWDLSWKVSGHRHCVRFATLPINSKNLKAIVVEPQG